MLNCIAYFGTPFLFVALFGVGCSFSCFAEAFALALDFASGLRGRAFCLASVGVVCFGTKGLRWCGDQELESKYTKVTGVVLVV